jgi:hypothetical protein
MYLVNRPNYPCTSAPTLATGERHSLIHRHVSFDLESFDALKAIQRTLEDKYRRSLTNAEVLRHVLLMHQA